MKNLSVGTVIENYKNSVKELAQDSNPGNKAIVVYGGYMGKSLHTLAALKEIGMDEYYPDSPAFPYNDIQKDWLNYVINYALEAKPVLILDSYWFAHKSCIEKIPEYVELVKSIPTGKIGFTLSKNFVYIDSFSNKKNKIKAGCFFEIKSNLIFLVGYSTPVDLIEIMPSFNFDFDGNQLLSYIRENIETIFPEEENITLEDQLEMVDLLSEAYKIGVYKSLDFKWIEDAFSRRISFERRKKDGETKEDFLKDFAFHLYMIKNGKIK